MSYNPPAGWFGHGIGAAFGTDPRGSIDGGGRADEDADRYGPRTARCCATPDGAFARERLSARSRSVTMRRPHSLGWVARATRALLVACVPTTDTAIGPLHRRNAPWRTRLCAIDEPGEPLSVTGTVTASADCRPIANATLDVWQTNARGLYSNLLGLENPANPDAFNLRGRVKTDHEGCYRFNSIVPGRYPLFWPLTRPRHIHLIVTHPHYEPLTTQIYFEGDKYNHSDPWWHASLTIPLERDVDAKSGRMEHRGTFDIALRNVSK
jgi:catechol 1,2-dioxygenase